MSNWTDGYSQGPNGLFTRPSDQEVATSSAPVPCADGCPHGQVIRYVKTVVSDNPGSAYAAATLDAKRKEIAVVEKSWQVVSEGCPGCTKGVCPRSDVMGQVARAALGSTEIAMSSPEYGSNLFQQTGSNGNTK